MVTIKITTKKKEKMSEHAEKALKHMGKLMQCIEELGEDDDMGERDEDDDDDYPMHERRRRSRTTGRYM